jgi:flagellin-like protein
MIKNRKGLSSVFSTVFLIMITVLGMATLFSFTTHYFTEFQLRNGRAIMEGSKGIIINFYNFGKQDLSIKQIYIDGMPVDFFTLSDLNGEPVDNDNINTGTVYQTDSIQINIEEHGSLILKKDASIGVAYNIKIFTERNSKFEFKVRRQ